MYKRKVIKTTFTTSVYRLYFLSIHSNIWADEHSLISTRFPIIRRIAFLQTRRRQRSIEENRGQLIGEENPPRNIYFERCRERARERDRDRGAEGA